MGFPADYGDGFDGSGHANRMNRGTVLLLVCLFGFIARLTLMVRQHATTVDMSAVDAFAGIDITLVFTAALVLLAGGLLSRALFSVSRTCAVWLLGYYLFCAVSASWSVAHIYSLYRAFEYLILFLATFYVVGQPGDFESAERWFLTAVTATIILQVLGEMRLAGFSMSLHVLHTNTYTASSGILLCYCLGEYLAMNKNERLESRKRAKRLKYCAAFSFCTLVLGTSAASNVAAAAGCLVIFLALRKLSIFVAGLFAALLAFCLAVAFGGGEAIVYSILFPGKSQTAIVTATGRTLLWQMLWLKFLNSPYIGYGFGVISGGRDKAFAALSHNSLFTVLIGTGIMGLFFFSIFILGLWRSALVEVWRRGVGTVGFIGALTVSFVNCLAMPLMADRWWATSTVFVWLIAFFLIHVRSANRPEVQAREEFDPGCHAAVHVRCSAEPSE
jgi:hypothetical protein